MTPEQEERQVAALEAIAKALGVRPQLAEARADAAERLVQQVSAERDAALELAGNIKKADKKALEDLADTKALEDLEGILPR